MQENEMTTPIDAFVTCDNPLHDHATLEDARACARTEIDMVRRIARLETGRDTLAIDRTVRADYQHAIDELTADLDAFRARGA
jgi:hypothetical protein